MSCRVLKRTMEEFIINTMVNKCLEEGITNITGEYIRTPKNNMVSEIYSRLGFNSLENGKFELKANEFKANETFINKLS